MGPEKLLSPTTRSGEEDLIGIWKYALDRIDRQIEIELNLINARMSWLVISESFLFNAFVAAGSDSIKPPGAGVLLQSAVAVMGFLIAAFVNSAVKAALAIIETRKAERAPMEARLGALMAARDSAIALPSVPLESSEHRLGSLPAKHIPHLLMGGWLLFAAFWGCRILWLAR